MQNTIPSSEKLPELVNTSELIHRLNIFEEALYDVLGSSRLDIAKEIAAEALEENLEEFVEEELQELDFLEDNFKDDFDIVSFEEMED